MKSVKTKNVCTYVELTFFSTQSKSHLANLTPFKKNFQSPMYTTLYNHHIDAQHMHISTMDILMYNTMNMLSCEYVYDLHNIICTWVSNTHTYVWIKMHMYVRTYHIQRDIVLRLL